VLRSASGSYGVGCVRKRDEKRIALRVDLNAPMRGECVSQEASMLGEGLRIRVRTYLLQQLRRSLDIGKKERDRP
jgi:hypothetical protein